MPIIESKLIDQVTSCFNEEILPDTESRLLRQGSKFEKHHLKGDVIANGLLQIHSNSHYPNFQKALLQIVLNPVIETFLQEKYQRKFKLVQTMVFHSNPETSLHTDDIYLDSNPPGALVGILIAFEDFSSRSGSISINYSAKDEIDDLYESEINHLNLFEDQSDLYRFRGRLLEKLSNKFQDAPFEVPFLKKGEFVSWNVWHPHKSFRGTDDGASRFSCAAHYIPVDTSYSTRLGANSDLLEAQFNTSSMEFS